MTKKKRITITLGQEEFKKLNEMEKELNLGITEITKSEIINFLIKRAIIVDKEVKYTKLLKEENIKK